MFKVEIENGYYLFKLKKLLNDRNISINKLITSLILYNLY